MAKTSKKKTAKKATKNTVKKATKPEPVISDVEKKAIDNTISHEVKDNITPHDKFNSMIFILGLIAVIVLLIVISPVGNRGNDGETQTPETFDGATLNVVASKEMLELGEEITIVVEGKNLKDLVGFELNVGFDPEVVEYLSTSYGPFLGEGGEKLCVPAENKGNVVTKIACIKLPEIPGQPKGVDGDGTITSLKFKAVGRGDPKFQVSNIKLLNSEKGSLEHQVLMPNPMVK